MYTRAWVLMSLFKSTGEPLLTDDFDKWTLIHGTSDLNTEFLTKSSPVSVCDIKKTAIQTTSSPQSFSI